ncbi:MAG TPA: AAA family ATPase, partial [Hanamia sp.]|nr:AAA family ATPase [Hanamia sp.]
MVVNKKPIPWVPLSDLRGETDLPILTPEELQKQQEEQAKKEEIKKLAAACLINLSDRLDPPPVAMKIVSEGKPITLFTKGNFSIITGAAKSRKSFLISLLIAASIAGKLQDLLFCESHGMNIIFDTEQAKYKVQQIGKRICDLSETVNPSNLLVYSLRTLEPAQRIEVIESVLTTTPNINFVAIDGIIDLEIDPILQADQAQKIVMKLMQWSEIYNMHITCVLHYNKTVQTLLGHLGSFSHRK